MNIYDLVKEIVSKSNDLKNKYTDEKNARVNYACIFCKGETDFNDYINELKNSGNTIIEDTYSGPLFKVNIDTVAGNLKLLKIRKHDDDHFDLGDADFTVINFNGFKDKYLNKPNFKLISGEDYEMIELSETGYEVRSYFSNPPIDEDYGFALKVYFSSYGLDTRYSEYMDSYNDIIEVLKAKKVAIIPNAKLLIEDRTNSVVAKEELSKNGIESDIIDIDTDKLDLDKYNALYLSGGEPKNLMDSIYKSNLYETIKAFIDNGGIVIGQSAGAMIFSKNYFDTTTGELLIQNNGFDYSPKLIVPHYTNLPKELVEKMPEDLFKICDNDRLIRL